MKFQIASDLHIEYLNITKEMIRELIVPKSDILVLAGDIGNCHKINQLVFFLKEVCSMFKIVLYVPGNHEFYKFDDYHQRTYQDIVNILYRRTKFITNLHILINNAVLIKDYCFIGCVLWSRIPEDKMFPYFRVRIKNMNKETYNSMHNRDISYISDLVSDCVIKEYKPIVITHYPPSLKCLDTKRNKDKFSYMYATDLEYMFKHVKAWVCGHIHTNFHYTIGNMLLESNQKGRTQDRVNDYNPSYIIEIN